MKGGLTVFLPQEQLNKLFDLGSDYFSGFLSDSEITDIDPKYIGSVIDLDSLSKISRQLNVSMGSMMYLLDGFSIRAFMISDLSLSKIIIEKNAQSISMAKILGYTNHEINRLYITATTIVVVLSLILTIPLANITIEEICKVAFAQFSGMAAILCTRDYLCENVCGRSDSLCTGSVFSDTEGETDSDDRCIEKCRIEIRRNLETVCWKSE